MGKGNNIIGERCDISELAKVAESELSEECVVREYAEVLHSTLGTKVQLGRMNQIVYSKIGRYTYTGQNTSILNASVGKFDSISWNVSIGGNTHDLNHVTTHSFLVYPKWGMGGNGNWKSCLEEECTVGNDVWIAAGVNVLRNVRIGNGAVIGAGCVVTKDVMPYSIVVGNPGRVVRLRCKEEYIESLEEISWWDFPVDVIRKHHDLFYSEINYDTIQRLMELKQKVRENK